MAAVPAGGEIHQAQAGDRLVVAHVDGQAPCRPADVDVHDVPASGARVWNANETATGFA